MARITTDEQNIYWAILASGVWRELGVIRRKEIFRPASLLANRFQDGGKITNNQIIIGEGTFSQRRGMPGDDCLHATRQSFDELFPPTGRIKIVEYIRAVFFNLRLQDFIERHTRFQAMLSRPDSLNVIIIAIGEECPLAALIHWQENMSCRFAKI
jgi:hypothetical protein